MDFKLVQFLLKRIMGHTTYNSVVVIVKILSLFVVPFGIYFIIQTGAEKSPLLFQFAKNSKPIKVHPRGTDVFKDALPGYRKLCGKLNKNLLQNSVDMIINRNKSLSFCTANRVASSYWSSVFQNGDHVSDGFKPTTKLSNHVIKVPRDYSKLKQSFRFIISENPYVLLFTIYLDLYRITEETCFNKIIFDKSVPICLPNANFQDFIGLVTAYDSPMWDRQSTTCNPCLLKPNFLSKMKNMTIDAEKILHVQLHKNIVSDINILIQTFKEDFKTVFQQGLTARDPLLKIELVLRGLQSMWRSYKLKGLIANSAEFPIDSPKSSLQNVDLTDKAHQKFLQRGFLHSYMENMNSLIDSRRLLLQNMRTYYQHISEISILKLKKKYKLDFKLFGYSDSLRDVI